MATRKEVADALKRAANSYWAHKKYACHNELGLARWGKYRADLIALNLRCEIIVCEVKSCVSDFNTDDKKGKWLNYLPTCNRFFWVFTEETWTSLSKHVERFKEHGCGVLVLDNRTGYLRSVLNSKRRPLSGSMQKQIVTRMAWRNGDVSKRTNRQRVRIFLE